MKILAVVLGFIICSNVNSQSQRFDVNPNPVVTKFAIDASVDHIGHAFVRNHTTQEIGVNWKRKIISMPNEWISFICDCNNCYADFVGQNPPGLINMVKAKDSCTMDVHVMDSGVDGSAHIQLQMWETDTLQSYYANYYFNREPSKTNDQNISLRIFPNPVDQLLNVDFTGDLKRMDIYNVLGKRMLAFDLSQGKQYNLASLNDGIYLAKLYGANGKLVRTVKIQKK